MVSLQVELSSRNTKPPKSVDVALILVALVAVVASLQIVDAAATTNNGTINSRALIAFQEPNGWFLDIMKVFFNDIEWEKVAEAREQVEKLIRKVESFIAVFRSKFSNRNSTKQETQWDGTNSTSSTTNRSWWGAWSHSKTQQDIDPTNLKAMLEKAACFVGYMRILNFSGQALADLDATKVVSNLFTASKMNGSSPFGWLG